MAKAMRRVKTTGKAIFTRSMYPGVAFCERCFCHHNTPECPFALATFKPTAVVLEAVELEAEAA